MSIENICGDFSAGISPEKRIVAKTKTKSVRLEAYEQCGVYYLNIMDLTLKIGGPKRFKEFYYFITNKGAYTFPEGTIIIKESLITFACKDGYPRQFKIKSKELEKFMDCIYEEYLDICKTETNEKTDLEFEI